MKNKNEKWCIRRYWDSCIIPVIVMEYPTKDPSHGYRRGYYEFGCLYNGYYTKTSIFSYNKALLTILC